MAKDTERKRKLEEQAEHTPKRLKQSQADSAKKTNSRGNASPQVQIPRRDGLKKGTKDSTPAKKETSFQEHDSAVQNTVKQATPKLRKSDGGGTEPESIASSNAPPPNAQNVMSKAALKKHRKETRKESLQTNEDISLISTADDDTSMTDTVTPKADAKSSRKSEQGGEADVGALTRVRSKEDKKQRSREKKARRKAEREVKAGVKEDEQLSAPNEHGWWLSPPSAGRYINHDPVFVTDENGDECLIAATIREVQLLHLDNSLISRTHIVPDGRAVQCFSLSAKYPDHVDITYDNGAKIQWNWTTGATSDSTYPGQEAVIASTTAQVSDGVPESFYISHAHGSYNINGGRKLLYSTYRPIRSIQVTQNASFIICFGTTALILGRRKEQTDTYVWLEMPMTVPPQCVDAKAILTMSKKNKALPAELVLAVGNADGKIHVYSDLASLFGSPHNVSLPAPRILHWHREAVSTVKFSRDGNYLISGGKESVMVIWQLETGHKQFLPHLTAEIERIVVSPDGTRYAVQMGDNSIMVLSTTELKPVANFAGLQLPVQSETSLIDGIQMPVTTAVLHPSDATQLLMTVPSTQPKTARDISTRPFLQTFDVRNSRHVSRQALSRNNVTDFNLGPEDTPILPPDVSQVAVSADGKWLATVDEWIVPGSDLEHAVAKITALGPHDILALKEQQARRREVYLKFWKWDANQGIWTLSTRVDGPHHRAANADLGAGAGSVLRLKSDPISNTFATVGQDGAVKLWKPRTRMRHGVPVKEEDGSDFVEWACKKTVALPVTADVDDDPADSGIDTDGPEDAPKTPAAAVMGLPSRTLSVTDAALAFSPDGSMIACSTTTTDEPMHPLVHFLDATTGAITATKTGIVPSDQEVKDLGFLDRYLIVLTYSFIRVWNLVDDSQHYTIALQGDAEDQQDANLSINQTDGTFAVVSSIVNEEDTSEMLSHIAVYRPKHNEALFEADLECVPSALLAGNDVRGYTILFEDGTIRSLSSAVPTTRRLSFALDAVEEPVEREEVDTAATSALALLQDDAEIQSATAQLTLEEPEDDRPVVRPEQLSSIFDVVGIPPVRDMFHAVVGLYARKPRRAVEAMEMELA